MALETTEQCVRRLEEKEKELAHLREGAAHMTRLQRENLGCDKPQVTGFACAPSDYPHPGQRTPPVGVKPRKLHDEQRALDLLAAMVRYVTHERRIPSEWIEELDGLVGSAYA